MKTIIIILVSLLSVSCMTVKRIEKHCSEFAKICEVPVKKEVRIITNIVTEIEYRDTIIYKYLPGKVVEKIVKVYINNGIVESDQSVLVTPLARSTAQVINSRLEHYLTQNDTTLQLELERALKTIRILSTEKWKTELKNTVTIKENTPFAKACIKITLGLGVIVILGIAYLILKNWIKILGLLSKIL